jgi:hypothetical protein
MYPNFGLAPQILMVKYFGNILKKAGRMPTGSPSKVTITFLSPELVMETFLD